MTAKEALRGQGKVSSASELPFHKMTVSFEKSWVVSSSFPISLNTYLQVFPALCIVLHVAVRDCESYLLTTISYTFGKRLYSLCGELDAKPLLGRFSLVSVQQLTVITVHFWSCQRIMQPHCGSQKLWTDFHFNGTNTHLNCNRENTGKLFSYIICLLCDFVRCSSAWDMISLNTVN